MVRWWLVLAVLGVLTGTAFAKREPPACVCGATITLPRPGATDVPTNARFWTIPPTHTDDAPDQPIQRYELQPHTAYELNQQHLSFTTGAGRDDTPPTEPGVGAISYAAAGPKFVAELHVVATFDSDTAVVRLRFRGKTYWTTPDAPTFCAPGFEPEDDSAEVEVVAYDLAGNASPPVTVSMTMYVVPKGEATCYEEHHYHCGTPLVALVYLGPFIALVAIILLMVVIGVRSSRSRAHSEPEPLALASALYLARAVRLRAHIWLGVVVGMTALATVHDDVLMLAFFGSPILIWLAIRSAMRWAQASRFSRLLGYDGVTAEAHGDRVTIVVGGKVALLRASPKLVERAKHNALPGMKLGRT